MYKSLNSSLVPDSLLHRNEKLLNYPHLFQQEGGIHILANPFFEFVIKMQFVINDFSIKIKVLHLRQIFSGIT